MTSSADWPCAALRHADLAQRTTMRVGGQVEWLLEPRDLMELQAAFKTCIDRGLRPRLLGGGANLLVDDGLLPGVVIATERLRRLFRPPEPGAADAALGPEALLEELSGNLPSSHVAPANPALDPRLVAWAGATLPALLRAARDLGYSGLEGIVGVPGSVGGGVAMNAGGRWGDMWDVVESVCVLDEDGEFQDLPRAECSPAYRDGGLQEALVVGAVLKFEPQPKALIQERMSEYLRIKNKVQPVTELSAGCIFKNPDPELADGRSAGLLVEQAGGKTLSRGAAAVSDRHGNFIVNRGGATAADVFGLMQDVRERVLEHSGVALEYEVKRWRPCDGED